MTAFIVNQSFNGLFQQIDKDSQPKEIKKTYAKAIFYIQEDLQKFGEQLEKSSRFLLDEFDSITAQIYNIEEIFESTQEKLKYCIEDNNFYVDIDNNYQEQIKKSENLAKLMMNLTKDEQNFNDKNAKKYVDYHMNENENKIEQFTTQNKIFPNDKKDRYEEKYLKNVFSLQEFLNFFLAKPKNAYFLYSQDHKEITEKKYQIWLKLDHKEKEYYLNKEKEEIKFVQLRKQEVLDFLIQNRKFPQFCKKKKKKEIILGNYFIAEKYEDFLISSKLAFWFNRNSEKIFNKFNIH